ncbi:hypothetical protein [Nocardia sp. alder85J]|uniref:hypothetical protein n=1 Tax=Nocardia sp. alder85J TaxID=2862949 RepID=UPI001CD6D552|nr:hypothetical protein [Nocardia sp. alder85J]MCX4090983.1 hypothetical protein [Nocardia sp. alder85J]
MFANRARAVLVAAITAAGVLGGTAAAQADAPGAVVQAQPIDVLLPGIGEYDHKWQGHDRSMELYYDGLGTISLFTGAADGEQWNVQWVRNDAAGDVTITLQDRTALYGAGTGGALSSGVFWKAALVTAPDTEVTVLHFGNHSDASVNDSNVGYFWCSESYGTSSVCGA